ncbi:MAG: hypothetical protein ACP5RC_03660 [Halothiobacillaceae bacterium]
MGFFSFICSAVGSLIGSVVSGIGSAVSSFVANVAPVIGSIIDAIKPVAEAIGRFANAFLQGLGILKPGEKVDDIGERALQAAEVGIKPEQFDNFDDYMSKLRDFELDPEKANQRSQAEKITAGLAVGTLGAEKKFGYEQGALDTLWLLPMTNAEYFTPERMQSLVSTGRFTGDVFSYLEKRLSGADATRMEKSFEALLGENPSADARADLYQNLEKARTEWQNLQAEMKTARSGES